MHSAVYIGISLAAWAACVMSPVLPTWLQVTLVAVAALTMTVAVATIDRRGRL